MIVIALAAAAIMASAVVVLLMVVFSVQGEDRHGQLPRQAPGPIAQGVRKLTGLRVCQPGEARLQKTPSMQKATRRDHLGAPADPAQVTGQPPSARTGGRSSG